MGKIYLYTGNGAGKTTNALGLALRALGHGQKVVILQFLKWQKDTGEMLFKHPNYSIYQFGREGWHGFKNITDEDRLCILRGLLALTTIMHMPYSPDLLILDEINLAAHLKLINEDSVLRDLRRWMRLYPNMNIVMTGRHATKTLINKADFVNEIVEIKAPKNFVCEKGIQW